MKYQLCLILCILHEVYPLFFILGEREDRCFFEEFEDDAIMSFQFNATLGESTSTVGLVVTVLGPKKEKMLMKEYGSHSTVNFRVSEPGEYGMCVGTNSTKWAIYASGKIKVHFQLHTELSEHHDDEQEHEENEKQHPPEKLRQKAPERHTGKPEHHIGKPKHLDVNGKKGKHTEEDEEEEKEEDDEKDEEKEGGEEKKEDNEGKEEDEEHHAEPGEHSENHLDSLESRIRDVQSVVKFITKMQAGQRAIEEKFRMVAETTNFRVVIWAAIQLAILMLTGWWQMRSLKSFFIEKKLV